MSDGNEINGIQHLKFTIRFTRSFGWDSLAVLLMIRSKDEIRFKDGCWSQDQEFICSKSRFVAQVKFSFHERWWILLWLMTMLISYFQFRPEFYQLYPEFILFPFRRVLKPLPKVSNADLIPSLSNWNNHPPFVKSLPTSFQAMLFSLTTFWFHLLPSWFVLWVFLAQSKSWVNPFS